MLAQNHSACAQHTCKYYCTAHPPRHVVFERHAERNQSAYQSADASHVCAYFPPEIDGYADYKNNQSCHYYCAQKAWHCQTVHQVKTCNIACYGKQIRHNAVFALACLTESPAVHLSVQKNGELWQNYCKACNHAEYNKAVAEVKKAWLAKHLPSVRWDEVNVVAYGYNKANFAKSADDVLFDDEEPNRNAWTGKAYTEHQIFEVLTTL